MADGTQIRSLANFVAAIEGESGLASQKKIRRLFIANRGEIARRIAWTASRLGIKTVCAFDSDEAPPFLMQCVDVLVPMPASSTADYLNIEKMIGIAVDHACDAVHPGFGFLSENADFARRCIQQGLTWVGPNPEAIDKMASKAAARHIAIKAQVPCLPALDGLDIDADPEWKEKILSFAKEVPFPAIVKAAYGGGGKGMRLAQNKDELVQMAERAASEAKSSFGNGLLVIEPYITVPRHVELQVFGDQHGNVVTFGDRDCSVQRRHQKIIEEAPAPELSDALREKMATAARSLAQTVGYDSAGTVEFLVDWSDEGRKEERFYFLEMNTRLQVEHPVTEEVFGIDLVELQILTAQGERLPLNQSQIKGRGHSIEMRLYAEDCLQNFLPSPGPVVWFEPYLGPGIRWEIGLNRHDEVSGKFDPMVGKIVAYGKDRRDAIARLKLAIQRTIFFGPQNNLAFIATILDHSVFVEEAVATNYLSLHLEHLQNHLKQQRTSLDSTAATIHNALSSAFKSQSKISTNQGHSLTARIQEVFQKASDSKNSHPPANSCVASNLGDASVVLRQVEQIDTDFQTKVIFGYGYLVTEENRNFCFARKSTSSERITYLQVDGQAFAYEEKLGAAASAHSGSSDADILAPVPGKVISVNITEGGAVQQGDTLFVLESMKMEFEVKAQKSGKIVSVLTKQGAQVEGGFRLAAWED
jgi:acetyl/propionyl-CoA carboxylase alpha subunit